MIQSSLDRRFGGLGADFVGMESDSSGGGGGGGNEGSDMASDSVSIL